MQSVHINIPCYNTTNGNIHFLQHGQMKYAVRKSMMKALSLTFVFPFHTLVTPTLAVRLASMDTHTRRHMCTK